MDYAAELRAVLRPLGLYNVTGGAGAAEIAAVGESLTGVWSDLTHAERESNPMTAEDTGLAAWEALLPFVPAYPTGEDRRRAIAALLRIDGASFTSAAINDTIAGCGMRALVEEADTALTVRVSFPYNRGEPDDVEELKVRIEQILPCHLAVEYVFVNVLWSELEALFADWAAAEAEGYTWRQMERLGGEDETAA